MHSSGRGSSNAEMFGKMLRFFRERAGLSQEALGLKIGYSKSQVAMVERGQRPPKDEFIAEVDCALGAQGALTAAGEGVTFGYLASWFEPFAKEEITASARHEYGNHVVPGILQTEDYARTVLSSGYPPVDDDEVEGRVAARLARQRLLSRKPVPDIGFVLELAALTRPIGGPRVHKEQLNHILEVGKLRHVQMQVMSPHRQTHAGLSGPFVLLETKVRRQLAYLEVQGHNFLVSEQPALGNLFGKYGILRAQALSPEESRDVIEQVAKDV
ncbi:helix-turn-helix domain-containing protein [Streptomyces sp. NPDC048473]|uniref:helix-turn-helix domain-containing protein n=1 Tax=unclassified Streptomyces TaxID=2593676 RepID=UPI0037246BB6